MTLGLIVLVIGPSALLALSLADDVAQMVDGARSLLDQGPLQPPDWLKRLPLVGQSLDEYWHRLAASRDEVTTLLKSLFEPARILVLGAGKAVGGSLLQLTFATFIAFFFYRDGESLVQAARTILAKLAGDLGDTLLATINGTVIGVVHGIFGTALAQALVALIGFVVAGVPGAPALAAATFLLSMVPVGPPLVWGGAAIWLFAQGSVGWGLFMVAWGLFAISSIDNFIKPYLISRASSLPLLLILLGVFGGIVAYGFIGIFIGPPMLAIGLTLVQLWAITDRRV
jgi:predicted PurR-regulated permease PerM